MIQKREVRPVLRLRLRRPYLLDLSLAGLHLKSHDRRVDVNLANHLQEKGTA